MTKKIFENAELFRKLQQAKQKLNKIKEMTSEPCFTGENCDTCKSGCMQKDILKIIRGEE